MAKSQKELVTCLVKQNGVVTRKYQEKRVIYSTKGVRVVRVMGRSLPLNSINEYELNYFSIPVLRGLEALTHFGGY